MAAKIAKIAKAKSMDRKARQTDMDWENYHDLDTFYSYFDFVAGTQNLRFHKN